MSLLKFFLNQSNPVSRVPQSEHGVSDLLLQRMIVADITLAIDILMAADADETGMLAGAIVMKRRRLLQRARLMDQRLLVRGPMRAAFQRPHVTAGTREHGIARADCDRRSAVAHSIEPKIGIDFRKARCVDSKS